MGNSDSTNILIKKGDNIKIIKENVVQIKQFTLISQQKFFQIHECNAVLFFNYGDPLFYASYIFENSFNLNQKIYQFMLVNSFTNDHNIKNNSQSIVYYELFFSNNLDECHKQINGFTFDQIIKGNVKGEISFENLFNKINSCLQFDFKQHFEAYFQLDDKQIQTIEVLNKIANNFIHEVISSYLFQISIYSFHKPETAQEFLNLKKHSIEMLMEIDFNNNKAISGIERGNKYFWMQTRRINKDGIIFELQRHIYSDSNFMFKGISNMLRKLNPLSPHTLDFRIIIYSKGEIHNHYEIFQSDDINLLQIKMDNIEKDPDQRFKYSSVYQSKKLTVNNKNNDQFSIILKSDDQKETSFGSDFFKRELDDQ